jgi:hypothetical protein
MVGLFARDFKLGARGQSNLASPAEHLNMPANSQRRKIFDNLDYGTDPAPLRSAGSVLSSVIVGVLNAQTVEYTGIGAIEEAFPHGTECRLWVQAV